MVVLAIAVEINWKTFLEILTIRVLNPIFFNNCVFVGIPTKRSLREILSVNASQFKWRYESLKLPKRVIDRGVIGSTLDTRCYTPRRLEKVTIIVHQDICVESEMPTNRSIYH